MKRIAVFLILALSGILLPASAHADGQLAPPIPRWWNDRAVKDIRYGQWLPCNDAQDIKDDCIEGINLYHLDGTAAGKLTYIPLAGFNPKTAQQQWRVIKLPDGSDYENYITFVDLPGSQSLWNFPSTVSGVDSTTILYAGVALFGDGLQVNIHSWDEQNTPSIPENYIYETVLRSKSLAKNSKWIGSNVKNPTVKIANNRVAVRGIPDRSPAPEQSSGQDVCQTNTARAVKSFANMAIGINLRDRGRATASDANPGDVVLGTNGWWCISDFRWDPPTQQIIVKVGNAHFDENGNVINGWLEVNIKGDRARKWWNMEPALAAGNAKVEITYQDGSKRIATATSQYDKVNDWLYVRAYGFTYSQPQLAIKFVKPKGYTTTITCVNKLLVKKVTGASPKCPAGFVKK